MIVVRILGGLGNQMFQYALGRCLSLERGVPLKLDVSVLERYNLHRYSLQHFAIEEQFATPAEIKSFAPFTTLLHTRAERWSSRFKHRFHLARPMMVESGFDFDPKVLSSPATCYLDGYFQSEKYFAAQRDLIRQEFQIKTPIDAENREALSQIEGRNSVSLHVRLGDYISNATTNAVHGTCGVEYYQAAIAHMMQHVKNPHFWVFSDDPEGAAKRLNLDVPHTFVAHNDAQRNYEDLRLMSACRHHVIANSTFSWWGAWLNPRAGKIVCAPRRWFANGNATPDLLPPDWVQL